MSMLDNRKAYRPLEENICYKAVLKNYIEFPNTNPAPEDKSEGYIQFIFTLEDGRDISNNCTFPVGTDILARQLIIQRNLPDAVEQLTVFNSCIKESLPLCMWVTHRELNGQMYTNYTFQEPIKPATPVKESDEAFH